MYDFFHHQYFQLGLRAGLALALLAGAIFLVIRAWPIFQALLIAVVIAVALWPFVTKLTSYSLGPKKWHLPRFLATATIYIVTFATAGAIVLVGISAIVPRLDDIISAVGTQAAPAREYLEAFRSGNLAEGARQVAGDVLGAPAAGSAPATAPGGAETAQTDLGPAPINAQSLAFGLFGGLTTLALVLVFTFFLLLDGDRFARWIVLAMPRDRRAHVRELGLQIRDHISRWVLAQLIYGLLSGLIVGIVMWALQMPAPHIFGIFGMMLALLPGIGPPVATIPAIFIAVNGEPWQLGAVVLFAVVYYIVDSTMIAPKIYGEMLQVPMGIVLFGLFLGGMLMGVWGALIAAPVAAALQMMIRDYHGRDPLPDNGKADV